MKEAAAIVWLIYVTIGLSLGATWPVWLTIMVAVK